MSTQLLGCRPLVALVLLLPLACGPKTTTEFEDAEAFFEFNTTANDLGLQIVLDAPGWRRVEVISPRKQKVFHLTAEQDFSKLGVTELRFESAEPTPPEVLSLLPPGSYAFRGKTVDGDALASTATLSHDFLPAPTISPSGGQVVDPSNVVVTWSAPGAQRVEIIIENLRLGANFDVTVPGSTTTRLNVPPQFLARGEEYKIEILAIGENRNRTLVESTFATKP